MFGSLQTIPYMGMIITQDCVQHMSYCIVVFIGVMIDGHHKVVMVMVFIGVMIDGHHKIAWSWSSLG